MQARSATIIVMMNSKGCISPICRFPISRITTMSVTKITAVRIKMMIITGNSMGKTAEFMSGGAF